MATLPAKPLYLLGKGGSEDWDHLSPKGSSAFRVVTVFQYRIPTTYSNPWPDYQLQCIRKVRQPYKNALPRASWPESRLRLLRAL